MTKKVRIILTLILLTYLAVASAVAIHNDGVGQVCTSMTINVQSPPDSVKWEGEPFVTSGELAYEIDSLPYRAKGMLMAYINPQELKKRLEGIDKVEKVEVLTYTDGSIRINVQPIIPVMRVFDNDLSYYVNRQGKRVRAQSRYRANVPIVMGHFPQADTVWTPISLLPLVDYLKAHPVWDKYVTMIRVDSPQDIVLVPAICEHEINIGAPDNFDDKFSRLQKFYTKVLPVKGWNTYNALSLKFNGQLVATLRPTAPDSVVTVIAEEEESVDPGTMLAGEGVAPGQAIKGKKAHNEQPIPAAKTN